MLAEAEGVSVSGAWIIEHAKQLAIKLRLSPERCPRLGPSWLRCLQDSYGLKWRKAFGESDSVNIEAAADTVEAM
ncbi:uncharacterized protein PITG_15859 [Phytophthora infestans T30-4]|uniref:HTH CENPB-type domain-containing protein n=1 Tax=Phytophthora infestans (strain T30-4) TaxID=403677 RepID=D0NRW8_PHYIT|nr:uncharacterized protein PITG_15859 [Phytophthora infestans T30-4]EEY63509.1 hypothetical protein PITG_15859 [Phytophthora infestans T30-4]|eukprot:XP_002898096.1 hypothetical protein PITG_15859 [Phytophthora infestans T30-4]